MKKLPTIDRYISASRSFKGPRKDCFESVQRLSHKNNRLTSHQSGNKKAHSTETLNILLTDKILEAMDKKQITALVLLDLSKAFDSIDHARLRSTP